MTGQFLLAMPGIGDPRFDHSVIAMCAHDPNGALGIGLGRVVEGVGLHTLLKQFEIATDQVVDAPVHVGGPVEPQRGFVLHSRDWYGTESIDVAGRWGLTATVDALRAIASGKGPRQWLVALGYAGWGPGQLDGEMRRHGWFVTPAETSLLWDTAPEARWQAGFASAGIDTRLLASTTGEA